MRITDILAAKRDGRELVAAEIEWFVQGVADGSVSDAQIAAFAMASLIRGMSDAETVALTTAMAASGDRLDWADLPGCVLDKHSSGGIGDKISLILAPVLAACGAYVPMISGRGLGHTGGTLDKLESLDGYKIDVDQARLQAVVREAGCAIVGATARIAPADRRIYAVRDLTATIESLALITASILSKKLAAAPQALVMDVKTGSGAFCRDLADAQALGMSIVRVAQAAGLPCRALITDMNQCLGRNAGNALEVEEALAVLAGEPSDARLLELLRLLAVELLVLSGMSLDRSTALIRVEQALSSGAAHERFERMAAALGASQLRLPGEAPVVCDIPVLADGFVAGIDARAIGEAVIDLGGGRRQASDRIDHRVGFSDLAGLGSHVTKTLGVVHARCRNDAERAIKQIQRAYRIGDACTAPPLLHQRIEA